MKEENGREHVWVVCIRLSSRKQNGKQVGGWIRANHLEKQAASASPVLTSEPSKNVDEVELRKVEQENGMPPLPHEDGADHDDPLPPEPVLEKQMTAVVLPRNESGTIKGLNYMRRISSFDVCHAHI